MIPFTENFIQTIAVKEIGRELSRGEINQLTVESSENEYVVNINKGLVLEIINRTIEQLKPW